MGVLKLKNGETIMFEVGLVHNMAIRQLSQENPAAFKVLVSACRDQKYIVPSTATNELKLLLKDLLVEAVNDDRTLKIHDTIRSVVVSAAVGSNDNPSYVSPFEGDD